MFIANRSAMPNRGRRQHTVVKRRPCWCGIRLELYGRRAGMTAIKRGVLDITPQHVIRTQIAAKSQSKKSGIGIHKSRCKAAIAAVPVN